MAVAVWLAGCATASPGEQPTDGSVSVPEVDAGVTSPPDASLPAKRRIVILMVGDGMGRPEIEAASLKATGTRDGLYMQSLAAHGSVRTASLSGITDSAAAATTMATGAKTFNGRIGQDRDGQSVQTLVERAHAVGMSAGLVTSTSLAHATPGAFSAHRDSRHDYVNIALDQVMTVQPDVMLGGGLRYYLPMGPDSERDDAGLITPLLSAGYNVVYTAQELAAAPLEGKLFGSFADEHLEYAIDRDGDTTEPTLAEMSLAAIKRLDHNEAGFFLLIEGGRIDHAGHGNDLARNVGETLAFDEAIKAVHEWQQTSDAEVTLVITADHECGGMTIESHSGSAGDLPEVSWRWGNHTNARVDVFADGTGADKLDGLVIDFTQLHAFLAGRVDGVASVQPPRVLTPDGSFNDLRYAVSTQTAVTGFGEGFNQLDVLHVDADANGIAVGVQGVFEWSSNALVVLVDVDYGAGSGLTSFAGSLNDNDGRVDSILSSLGVDASAIAGFGADYALVIWGGQDPHLEDLIDDAGLRGFTQPSNLPWFGAATNFGEGVRTSGNAATSTAGEGFETVIPWSVLYDAGLPANATVAISVLLVNDDGGYASNQALPPFAADMINPGRGSFPLPGVAVIPVDADGDGVVDADLTPFVDF